jgi:hypothetical protein
MPAFARTSNDERGLDCHDGITPHPEPLMGAQNVALVCTRWTHLNHVAFRALVFMALVSMDSDHPPKYWGGRTPIARVIGATEPGAEPTENDFRAAGRAVKLLVDAGALAVDNYGAPGRNTTYSLHLLAARIPKSGTQRVRIFRSDGYESLVGTGTNNSYPEEQEEQVRNTGGAKSRSVGESPPREQSYPQARDLLEAHPDLGRSYIDAVPAHITGLRERMIAAAALIPKKAS